MIAAGKRKKGRKRKECWAAAMEFNEVRLMYKKIFTEQKRETNSTEEQVPGFEVTSIETSRGRMQVSIMQESISHLLF